jgi:enoyl-CoA hydratase/carnithine racemase|tara:strand:+ start:28 stop:813 length:786 start_codon:yes stop_codon:yes gene_type:complete
MTRRYKYLHYEVSDGIASITLDRPPVNAINEAMTDEYFDTLQRADEDNDIKVVILSGKGKGLSAGADLKYLAAFGTDEMARFLEKFYVEQVERVRGLSKPIIAAVHGYAREGACTMAFTCDMVVASDDASFGYPGVPNLAAPPGMHVWHLQKLIGRMRAAELILTGDPIEATEAGRLGLVTKVVPRENLADETKKLAKRLATMSPIALKVTRDLLYEMENMDFKDVPRRALMATSGAFDSEDSKEARRAFNEKRAPVWKGR